MAKSAFFLLFAGIAIGFTTSPVTAGANQLSPPASVISSTISDQAQQLSRIAEQTQKIAENLEGDANKKKEEEHKIEREIEDLNAQTEMAKWAKWMFFATLFSSVLAAISIYFIYLTVRQNAKALESSKASSNAQIRPYIGITVSDSYKDIFSGKGYPFVEVRFKNHGTTPARNISIAVGTLFRYMSTPEDYKYEHLGETPPPALILMPTSDLKTSHVFREAQFAHVQAVKNREFKIHVNAEVTYNDVFDNKYKTTMRFIILNSDHGEVIGYASNFGNTAE
jgi:hypothetical protein